MAFESFCQGYNNDEVRASGSHFPRLFNGFGKNLHGHNLAVKVVVWTDAAGDMLKRHRLDPGDDYLSSRRRSSDGYVKLAFIAGGCC